jgi:hypothetical protein
MNGRVPCALLASIYEVEASCIVPFHFVISFTVHAAPQVIGTPSSRAAYFIASAISSYRLSSQEALPSTNAIRSTASPVRCFEANV